MVKQTPTRLLGFNYTELKASKNPTFTGKVDINSNIAIDNMEKAKGTDSKNDILKVDFSFSIDYEKDLGKVSLKGLLFVAADSKQIKQTISAWKDKKTPTQLYTTILNIVLQKTAVKAIEIEDEIGLPIHLQNAFPKVSPKSLEKK
jgi:hypothetical protein